MMKGNKNFEVVPVLFRKKFISVFDHLNVDHPFRRDYRSWNNCLTVVRVLLYKQFDSNVSGFSSVEHFHGLSAEYWQKVFASHYSRYLNFLLDHEIIQRRMGRHIVGDKLYTVYGYRINPELNEGDYVNLNYKEGLNSSAFSGINKAENLQSAKSLEFNLEHVSLQWKKNAAEWVSSNVENIIEGNISESYFDGLPSNLSMPFIQFADDGSLKENFFSVQKAQEIAQKEGLTLFHYRNRNIIADIDYFLNKSIASFKHHYLWCINDFSPEKFNLSRNRKTRRVYGQLVSLPSSLLQFIRIHNQFVVQADLKCSQFNLFANLINSYLNREVAGNIDFLETFKSKKSKDFIVRIQRTLERFKESLPTYGIDPINPVELPNDEENDILKFLQDVFFHDFYSVLRSELNLQSRDHAKLWAFTVVFGKPKTNSALKRQMSELYPTVIQIIDDFKKTYKSNDFAIGLQIIEAELFIDNIWTEAKKKKITSFTRHDSIICAISKQKEISDIIDSVKLKFGLISSYVFENFNAEEIEQLIFSDSDYLDSLEDIDMCDVFSHIVKKKHPFADYAEWHIETMKELVDIGVMEEYYDDIDLELLEAVYDLPDIDDLFEGRYIAEDVWNLRQGYTFFQDRTNDILRELISILSSVDFDEIYTDDDDE